jgi:hypothetical protein
MAHVYRLSAWFVGVLALAGGARAAEPAGVASPAAEPAPETAGKSPPGGSTSGDKAAQSGDKAKPAAPTGGYSWSDKPRKRARRAPRLPKHDAGAPVVTFPGFRLRPDGTSVIWVTLSRRSSVVPNTGGRLISYHLPGVYVDVRNNTNPLVTTHFATSVRRTWLRPDKDGASLMVELRAPLTPTHRVVDGPRGTMVLEVTIPAGGTPPRPESASSRSMILNSGSPPAAPRKRPRSR